MKTNFFLTSLIIVLFSITANSQITKGNWMVGGDGSFYSFTTERAGYENTHSTSVRINPNINYFIIDKLAIGIKIGTSFNRYSTSLGVNPVVRYYFLKPNKMFNLFSEASFGYSKNFSKNIKNYYSNGFTLKTGSVVFLNQSVGLEFGIEYIQGEDGLNDNISKTIIAAFGLQIHLEKK